LAETNCIIELDQLLLFLPKYLTNAIEFDLIVLDGALLFLFEIGYKLISLFLFALQLPDFQI
jgi:hypothetical protein